jgi:glycosyltransferase involved in cell wall biosynthesis
MAGWDIFVMPSLDEGFGLAALEAMATGLPVVAAGVGGIGELVQHGRTGWLVPPGAPDELASRLRDLLHDQPKRERMGAEGRRRALSDFAASRMVEQIVAVYDGLISKRRGRM